MNTQSDAARWLMLIHQIPPHPAYLRVKVGRRLAKVGAVALKNSVYVLPDGAEQLEDFQWIAREIIEEGGEATISAAHFLEGLQDEAIRGLFRSARDVDYLELAETARQALAALDGRADPSSAPRRRELSRLQQRFDEIASLDFFQAPARNDAETALMALRGMLVAPQADPSTGDRHVKTDYNGRTWVTREGIKVDRIASAWLIRRFIDPAAHFKFVPPQGYRPKTGELRFDMFEAEFTHEGDACSFEVLLNRLGPEDDALRAIAEIVHDIDLKDAKFDRTEAPGVASLLTGIASAHAADEARLERGAALFDDLYASLRGSTRQPA